ncbi:hypothetical protein FQN57_001804 [Myotisia sp. PD_48]|nr:hypothetical protein FQN57_001804 [Myotisia sp. PD_48]
MKLSLLLASAATVALAAPTSDLSKKDIAARQLDLIYPTATFRYWIHTGEVKEDPQDQLLIVKNGNDANESSTIVTFQFDDSLSGRECQLLFDLWDDRDHSTGTQNLDVFSRVNPPTSAFNVQSIPALRPAGGAGYRDRHQGRIHAVLPGSATWIESLHGWPVFDCPVNELIGIEFVGAGDLVEVRWDIGVTGPRIQPVPI